MKFLLLLLLPCFVSGQDEFDPTYVRYPFQTITPDAGSSPTTTQAIIQPGNNAIRLQFGYVASYYNHFFIYYNDNGTSYKIDAYRMTTLLLKCAAYDVIKIGCDSSFPISFQQYADPLVRPTPTGVSATCQTDSVAPMQWFPAAAHLVLPDKCNSFTIAHNGTQRTVFVKENDGYNWGNITAYIVEANKDLTIFCVNKNIALGTYTGLSLSITAPLYTLVNSHSYNTTFAFRAITGTVRNVTAGSGASLVAALNAFVLGDLVSVPAGNYHCETAPAWTANIAAGHKGAAGLTLVGATGNRGDVVIYVNDVAVSAWTLNNSTDTNGVYFANFTIRGDSSDNPIDLISGHHYWYNMRVAGSYYAGSGGVGELLNIAMNTASQPVSFYAAFVNIDSGYADHFDANAFATGTTWAQIQACSIVCVSCGATFGGNFANSQLFTSHFEMPYTVSGGLWNDANANTFANGAGPTYGYLEFLTVTPGSRAGGVQQCSCFGCILTLTTSGALSAATTTSGSYFNNITLAATSSSSLVRNINAANINHNVFNPSGSGLRGYFYNATTGTPVYVGNLFLGTWGDANYSTSATSGSTAVIRLIGNSFVGNGVAVYLGDLFDSTTIANNAFKSNTTNVDVVGSAIYKSYGHNVMASVTGTYTSGTGDITNAASALDGNYTPTVGGNVDAGQGDNTQVGYIGGKDWRMLDWIQAPSLMPVGASCTEVDGSNNVRSAAVVLPTAK